jgi:uncharacterized protein
MRCTTVLVGLAAAILSLPTVAGASESQPEAKQSRPSFDCRRAGTRVEHLICGDAHVSQLDRRMASAYATFLRRISTREQARLRENQRLWLVHRNQCTTVECLIAAYDDRIAWLEGFGRY